MAGPTCPLVQGNVGPAPVVQPGYADVYSSMEDRLLQFA